MQDKSKISRIGVIALSIINGLIIASLAPAADAPTLLPIPDPSAITKAEKFIADVYKPYPPTKAAEQKALAAKFLEQAKDASNDPASRYVLFRDAGRLAANNADLETALFAIDQSARYYDVDTNTLKRDALKRVVGEMVNPFSAQAVLMPVLKLSDQALKDGNYDLAQEAADAADKACRTVKDLPMMSFVKEQVTETGEVQAFYQNSKSSLEKLATSPDDPEANLTAGKFLCFVRNQWDVGLPMLAKSSDGALKVFFQLDKSAGKDSAAQTKAADAWWDMAQSQNGIAKRGILRRAAYWYGQALPALTGLNRPLAQKRLDEATAGGRQGTAKMVDLMPLIDPSADTVSGKGEIQSAGLTSSGPSVARIETPYEPPAEYDFRIEFTRLKGNDCVAQILAANDTSFIWEMAAVQNTLCGFDQVAGKAAGENAITVRVNNCLELNHRYTSLVQVRKDLVRASVSGKLISEWKTDFKDMSIHEAWQLRNPKAIGVGSFETTTIFHSIVVIELSGAGKKTR